MSEDVVVDSQQVGQIIKDLIESNKMVTRDVAISVPQNTVITQQVVVTGDNEREIESEIENSGKKYIHTDIDEVEFDFKILSESPDGTSKTILLVACKQKILHQEMTLLLLLVWSQKLWTVKPMSTNACFLD